MALQQRISRHELASTKNENDITNDLTSLSFEHALSIEERNYLPIRTRYHAFTITSCAHAAYLVATMNEIRQVLSEIRNPINKKTIKFLNHTPPRNPLKVGVIGCGRLGKQIVSCLLAFSDIRPSEITISTRRPDSLSLFHNAGIKCVFDNKEVVATCNIVFLCCLPSNMSVISSDIAGYISADCLVFSFVTSVTLPRLRQMLQHTNVAKMDFTWSKDNLNKEWSIGDDVVNSLEKEWLAELTCPLTTKSKEDAIVWSSAKTFETAIYTCLNMCPTLNVTPDEALNLINIVFLTKMEGKNMVFKWKDFLDDESISYVDKGDLPVFDLYHVNTQDTPLTEILKSNSPIQEMMAKKFCSYFNALRNAKEAI